MKQLANVLTPDVNRPLGRNVRNPTSGFAKWGVFIHRKGDSYVRVSIYLSKERVKKQEEWLKVAKKKRIFIYFTSLHIPEDDPNTYKELIQILGKQALENEMELMVDVSQKSLHHLGMTYENVEELVEWGITGLRMDYGITPKEIARVSHKMKVALNASTITDSFWKELLSENIRVKNVEAW